MFKLSEIASVLQGRLIGPDCGLRTVVDTIGAVTTDSRQARPGQLFFALKGPNYDGHDFARQAYEKSGTGVVVEREIKDVARQIVVADTIKALGVLANFYRRRFAPTVIAITGTNGKTTTKNLIGDIMQGQAKTVMTEGTLNNQIGLPLTLLRLAPETRYCVLEMGTNHPGEIDYLCRIAEPDIGVLTNIGYGHLAGFETRNDLVKEKLALVRNLPPEGKAVVNATIKGVWTNCTVVTFSLHRNGRYHAARTVMDESGSTFYVGKNFYRTGLLGRSNIENIVGAIATTQELGTPYAVQQPVIESIKPAAMRLEPVTIGPYFILNDCYNANPNSMKEALRFMGHLKRRKLAVLGDMLELGKSSVIMHKRVGEFAGRHVDILVTVGDQAKLYGGNHFAARDQAIDFITRQIRPGDGILFKASRALKFEELVAPVVSYIKDQGGT